MVCSGRPTPKGDGAATTEVADRPQSATTTSVAASAGRWVRRDTISFTSSVSYEHPMVAEFDKVSVTSRRSDESWRSVAGICASVVAVCGSSSGGG
ncbi:MAG: hypothetical protein HPM95_14880 [Alphaproteobacteria bacterium]|nr:hypothetical protein [Alphaproteobacteria bacterium]